MTERISSLCHLKSETINPYNSKTLPKISLICEYFSQSTVLINSSIYVKTFIGDKTAKVTPSFAFNSRRGLLMYSFALSFT